MRILLAMLLLATVLAAVLLSGSSIAAPAQYDLIIRNGGVIDGTGRAAFRNDLAITGDRIVEMGDLRGAKAKRVIDARGLVVAPGFIDMLGQSEQYVLIDPRAMSKVMMGVTTEITGEGNSIAPMNERLMKEDEPFYRRFNLTVDWRTFTDYFRRVERQGMGINLGTFVGATQVRAYVIGFDNRAPTPAELEQMRQLVAEAMQQGALGLSTSLQYVPARFAKTDDIVELAKVARRYGGIYATHQRSEANALDSSLAEVFEIARRARIHVEIWHLKTAYKKNWGRMPEVLRKIEAARREGLDITADVYPYTAASTGLTACLPPWAQEGGTDKMLAGSKSHPRGWGSYPRILARYVRAEHLLTLEDAIHKMTGASAARVGLRERGLVRAGLYADLTLFDPARVRDRATFDEPNQYPEGIEYVIVNGQIEVDKGERTPANAGRVLRGPGYRKP